MVSIIIRTTMNVIFVLYIFFFKVRFHCSRLKIFSSYCFHRYQVTNEFKAQKMKETSSFSSLLFFLLLLNLLALLLAYFNIIKFTLCVISRRRNKPKDEKRIILFLCFLFFFPCFLKYIYTYSLFIQVR